MPPAIPLAIGYGVTKAAESVKKSIKKSLEVDTPEIKAPEIPESATETAEETITESKTKATAVIRERQKAARRSMSIFTSPLGLSGQATTIKKVLLGQ